MQMWRPFENLRHEVDRLFDDFYTSLPFRPPFRRPAFDIEPFWAPESWVTVPAVDFVEHDDAFEMTADLPGLDEKNIELKVANGVLTVKGEKTEDKEEKKEGLPSEGASVRLVRALVPDPRDGGHGQDRGELQAGRAHREDAQDRRGSEVGEEDRGEGRLTKRIAPCVTEHRTKAREGLRFFFDVARPLQRASRGPHSPRRASQRGGG